MSYLPTLVSERQPTGHWARCLESSFEMLTDKMSLGTQICDARKLEAAIPDAANGTSVVANIAAITEVYPQFPVSAITATRSTDTMELLLQGGKGFAIVGNYHDLPSHFQRWDPAFAATNPAGHATYIQIDGPSGVRKWSLRDGKFVWWMDPLATTGYAGEWMELATMFGFLNGSTNAYGGEGSAVASGAGPSQPVVDVIYSRGGLKTALVKAGTPYAHEPAGPTVGTIGADTRYLIAAFDVTGKWCAIDGNYLAPQAVTTTPMGWITTAEVSMVEDAIGSVDCTAAIAADRAKAHIVWE